MARILHTADLHLDAAFTGLTGERAALRRARQRELLREIVDLANREGAEVLLMAGDLFDGKNAYSETVSALAEELARCRARVFIAPGNHDAYHSMSPYRAVRLPKNVHLFKTGEIESVDISELNLCVHGAAFTSSDCEGSLLRNFRAPQDGRIHVMVMHGAVTEGVTKYNAIREEDIRASGLSYLALGHVHSFDRVHRAGVTAYAYCGCPEGRGFDECGDKGVLLGDVSLGGADMEFYSTAKYRYSEISLHLSEGEDALSALLRELPERDEFGLYRVELHGEHDAVDTASVEASLADRYGYISVTDRTVSPRPIWEGEEQDTLRGAFLRGLHKRYLETGDAAEQEKIKLAARFGVCALDNREEPR